MALLLMDYSPIERPGTVKSYWFESNPQPLTKIQRNDNRKRI